MDSGGDSISDRPAEDDEPAPQPDDALDELEDESFDDETEISLEQLSQAYSQVIRDRSGESDGDAADAVETDEQPRQRRGQLVADKVNLEDQQPADNDEVEIQTEDPLDDDATCPISPESIVESMIFVGAPRGEPLTAKNIAAVLRDVTANEVKQIARSLNERYIKEQTAFRILVEKDRIAMVIAEDLTALQDDYHGRNRQVRLPQSAIDVLAVVAWQQPITAKRIEEFRDRPSGSMVKQLLKRGLLEIDPSISSNEADHYITSGRFLEMFHLVTLDDLPHSQSADEFDDFAD